MGFSQAFREASYEPELHPGVTYKIKYPKATLKIFSTGSITVTAPSVANVEAAIKHIYPKVFDFQEFLQDLYVGGPDDCRYGVFDFEYTHQCQGTTEASKKEKLFLISWCPDSAKIKKKMLYSSSFDALKKCLVGVQKYIQATDESEAS